MREIKELFQQLIDAFDKFLDIEEKEIGCLDDKEHARFLADRNYYSELLVKKTSVGNVPILIEELIELHPNIFDVWDDAEDIGNYKRKTPKDEIEF